LAEKLGLTALDETEQFRKIVSDDIDKGISDREQKNKGK
jgi:hypothetical protein